MSYMLRVADDVCLSLDYATKVVAILAQRRKGKTYTASVVAEELVRLGVPWVALDPTGAWWGLRSSADGRREGLPVIVLGGNHGHLPLTERMGHAVADLVLDHAGWYVLDLSLFDTRAAERRFATDFADRLYRRKGEAGMDFPLHLFVDEADMFAPQEREAGEQRMLGAYQAIVRRGGLRGLGCTLICQRPALLNKSVLTQLDLLILLRLVAGQDQDAVRDHYLKRQASKDELAVVMGTMAALKIGEAWLFEPGGEPRMLHRTTIRPRSTFNSSATPKAGETTVVPTVLSQIDVSALQAILAEEIERAEADDPDRLRARIRDLERQAARHEPVEHVVDKPVPVPFIPPEVIDLVGGIRITLQAVLARINETDVALSPPHAAPPVTPPARPPDTPLTIERPPRRPQAPPVPSPVRDATTDDALGKAERAILAALAPYAGRTRSRRQIGFLAGYSPTSGHVRNTLSELRRKGYVVGGGDEITITDAGLAVLGDYERLPTGSALRDYWLGRVGKAERAVLTVLLDAWPSTVSRAAVARFAGYEPGSGHVRNTLSNLRTLELVQGRADDLRAADELFEEAT